MFGRKKRLYFSDNDNKMSFNVKNAEMPIMNVEMYISNRGLGIVEPFDPKYDEIYEQRYDVTMCCTLKNINVIDTNTYVETLRKIIDSYKEARAFAKSGEIG